MQEKTAFLGTQNIRKLLWKMSAPAMVGMLVIALYNVVDTIFIGQAIGDLGIAGVTVSFPLQTAFFALALSVGIGGASEISRLIGAGKTAAAEKVQGTAAWLVFVGSIILLVLGLLFLEPILFASGANAEVLPFGMDYARVILYGSPFLIASVVGNSLVRAEGNAKLAMMVMVGGALVNVFLDWLFLFVFETGIEGAAWATSISNVVSFLILVPFFCRKKGAVPFLWKFVRWNTAVVKKIMVIGSASFMREVAILIEMVVLNHVLIALGGSVAIAAIGILMRLAMMVLMPIFGIVQGMQPIAGYNFGAEKYARVRKVFWSAMLSATVLSVFAFCILFFAPGFWVELFVKESSTELIAMTTEGLQWMILGFGFVGIQVVISGLYQSLGFGKQALFLSLFRQVILLVPLVLILSHYYGLVGVWMSFPISDVVSTVVTVGMVWVERRKVKLCVGD